MNNRSVDHLDVVGVSPVGVAPTISSFSNWLASRDWVKTIAGQDGKHLNCGIWCLLVRDVWRQIRKLTVHLNTCIMPSTLSSFWSDQHNKTSPRHCLYTNIIYYSIYALIARFMSQCGAHLEPAGPRWAPCWPHEFFYLGEDNTA